MPALLADPFFATKEVFCEELVVILGRHPDWLEWLIIQNANSYEGGFTGAWEGLRHALWVNRSPENEAPLEAFLAPDGVRTIYLHGHRDPKRISPDAWNMDLNFLARPHAHRGQLDLFYDYRTNVALYPQWQAFLRAQQPLTGFYFAVLKEGEVAAGDPISLLHRDEHQMPLNL